MTDASYRLAIDIAVTSHAARAAAAMAHHFRGRPAHSADRNAAVVSRMRALARLSSWLGVATVSRAVRRTAPLGGEPQGNAAYRTRLLVSRAAPKITRRSPEQGKALLNTGTASAALRRRLPAAQTARAAPGAKPIDVRAKLPAEPRLHTVLLSQNGQRGLTRRVTGKAAAAKGGAELRPTGQGHPRMAVLASVQSETARAGPSFRAPGIAARLRHQVAAPLPLQADATGFHRTVRQGRPAAHAGDVFLDKSLVGYHLAAAITAEQTRAAARPNISGSSFNSSMAALRPSGAGL